MTPKEAENVASLLRQARLKRGAAWRAFDRCDIDGAGILQREAQGYEADAEKLDPGHECSGWHVERE